MSKDNRQRGTMLRRLDGDATRELALKRLAEIAPDVEWVSARLAWDFAIAESKSGELYLICSEGVGWHADEKTHDFALQLALTWREEGETRGTMTGERVPGFTADELRSLATAGEVDLADFVRVFGDRLESNFRIWHSTLAS